MSYQYSKEVINVLQLGRTLTVYKSGNATLNVVATSMREEFIHVHLVEGSQNIREEIKWGNTFNTSFDIHSAGTYCVVVLFYENNEVIAQLKSESFKLNDEVEIELEYFQNYLLDESAY